MRGFGRLYKGGAIVDKIVYWLENGRGNKYHLYRDCYYMGDNRPDARSGSVTQAKAAGHEEACKVCEERAKKQEEHGEDFSRNTVYWRYGSDETVWHLYENCPRLAGAAEDDTLCSGRVEAAINTGRIKVCPVCKERSDKLYWDAVRLERESTPSVPIVRTETKPAGEAKRKQEAPAANKPGKPAVIRRTNWAAIVMTAVCTALCAFWICNYNYNIAVENAVENAYQDGYAEGKALADDAWQDGYEAGYDYGRVGKPNSYVVYVTPNGKRYHKKDCSYLKSTVFIMDVQDAIKAGYTACNRCNP
jgi:hypothetical protein